MSAYPRTTGSTLAGRILALVLLLFLGFPGLAGAQAVSADPQNGAVQGTITSSEDQQGLERVNLVLTDMEGEMTPYGAMSLKDGTYVVGNVPPGSYILRAAALGYQELRSEPFTVRAGVVLNLDMNLRKAPSTGTIKGKVTHDRTGDPIPAANVLLLQTDGTATRYGAFTDASGEYVIINVPPGRYHLKAVMIGYKRVLVEDLLVGAGIVTTHNFRLAPQQR